MQVTSNCSQKNLLLLQIATDGKSIAFSWLKKNDENLWKRKLHLTSVWLPHLPADCGIQRPGRQCLSEWGRSRRRRPRTRSTLAGQEIKEHQASGINEFEKILEFLFCVCTPILPPNFMSISHICIHFHLLTRPSERPALFTPSMFVSRENDFKVPPIVLGFL